MTAPWSYFEVGEKTGVKYREDYRSTLYAAGTRPERDKYVPNIVRALHNVQASVLMCYKITPREIYRGHSFTNNE